MHVKEVIEEKMIYRETRFSFNVPKSRLERKSIVYNIIIINRMLMLYKTKKTEIKFKKLFVYFKIILDDILTILNTYKITNLKNYS